MYSWADARSTARGTRCGKSAQQRRLRGEIPGEPRLTYSGTKLETADTAKESRQLLGPPLLGDSPGISGWSMGEGSHHRLPPEESAGRVSAADLHDAGCRCGGGKPGG